MSHFSELKTKLSNRRLIVRALEKLGFTVIESEQPVEVRGFFGAAIKADFKVLTKTHYDIGFLKNAEGNYEVVGDWELLPQVSGIEQEPFMKQLKREYAKAAITELAENQGYELQTAASEDGTIEMLVSQW